MDKTKAKKLKKSGYQVVARVEDFLKMTPAEIKALDQKMKNHEKSKLKMQDLD